MNEFVYIQSATNELQNQLLIWRSKSQEYINEYFEGDPQQTIRTEFGNCVSKIRILIESLEERSLDYRSVIDNRGLLQAAAIITDVELIINKTVTNYVEIESLTNAPWNVIKNQPETIKGAATSLLERIVTEAANKGYNGAVKAFTIPLAKPFYLKNCFIETNGTGEVILTQDGLNQFLLTQSIRRLQPFD